MRWEDERYVRLYASDDGDWSIWPWQSRCVFPLLLRRCNRIGAVKVGKHGARALAALLRLPEDVTAAGLAGLIEDGCVTEPMPGVLFVRNYLKAQEAAQSDKARKAAQRDRDQAKLEAIADGILTDDSVTNRDAQSQDVTKSHERSRDVTPCRAVPCRAVKDPPISPASGGVVALELSPPAPAKRPTRSEKKATTREAQRQDSIAVLDALNTARLRVIPGARPLRPTDENLTHIAERLAAGATLDECLHVVAVRAEEVRANSDAAQWFNAVTPFRPDGFAASVAQPTPTAPQTRPGRTVRTAEEQDAHDIASAKKRLLDLGVTQ